MPQFIQNYYHKLNRVFFSKVISKFSAKNILVYAKMKNKKQYEFNIERYVTSRASLVRF